MWSIKRTSILATALAVAVQAAPAAANEVDIEKAEALRARAASLFNIPGRWTEAARLLEESVTYRPAHDPAIHSSLMIAASIWVSVGDVRRGYELAVQAGESAHARGAVLDAAHTFMSAAAVAVELGDRPAAERLVNRARLLAASPLLAEQDRDRILARDVSEGFTRLWPR